jgi:hypothetical protein
LLTLPRSCWFDWLLITCLLGNEVSSWVLSMFKISYLVIGKSPDT